MRALALSHGQIWIPGVQLHHRVVTIFQFLKLRQPVLSGLEMCIVRFSEQREFRELGRVIEVHQD